MPTLRLAWLAMVPGSACLSLWAPSHPALLALWILAPPAVGVVIGWLVRARVSMWVLLALPGIGVSMFVIGWSDYNDDGGSGPLLSLVAYSLPVLVLSVMTAGLAAGAHLRKSLETGHVRLGVFELVSAVALAYALGLLSGVHVAYVVSGTVVLAMLWKTGAWWSGCLVPYGFGVWATFLSLGIRTRRRDWLVWAAAYAAIAAAGWFVAGIDQSQNVPVAISGAMLCVIGWGAGVLHALRIRAEVRDELARGAL